jgi:tetratricopeptide (TPR) repeat protein
VGRNAAQQCYLEALRQDVLYAPAWRGLGDLLREGGEMVQALSCYQEAVRLRPCYAGRQTATAAAAVGAGRGQLVSLTLPMFISRFLSWLGCLAECSTGGAVPLVHMTPAGIQRVTAWSD